jgi:hypothetical protein
MLCKVTLAWRRGIAGMTDRKGFCDLRFFCAAHKNPLDRCSRSFYISIVLQCSKESAAADKKGLSARSLTGSSASAAE